jgi:hydrogenase expression/formation protein HypD
METAALKNLAGIMKKRRLNKEIRVMEVCGTHTVEFFKTGVRSLLPEGFSLIDGPGCPVCVTPGIYLDRAVSMASEYKAVLMTFGDMLKVPSSSGTLMEHRASGMDIRMIYSPLNALEAAEADPDREYILLSVGFETTAPTAAATLLIAESKGIRNFSILPGNKLTPPAVAALLSSGECRIDGFILPGHVSAVTGSGAWNFIASQYSLPAVVSGFSAFDLITGVLRIIDMIESDTVSVENLYPSVVKEGGNSQALQIIDSVFDKAPSEWRGIGSIPESGLKLNERFSYYDALLRFPVNIQDPGENPACRCGELLRGLIAPPECPLYGKLCTPDRAVGPCMVSSEGPCAAYHKYGGAS